MLRCRFKMLLVITVGHMICALLNKIFTVGVNSCFYGLYISSADCMTFAGLYLIADSLVTKQIHTPQGTVNSRILSLNTGVVFLITLICYPQMSWSVVLPQSERFSTDLACILSLCSLYFFTKTEVILRIKRQVMHSK